MPVHKAFLQTPCISRCCYITVDPKTRNSTNNLISKWLHYKSNGKCNDFCHVLKNIGLLRRKRFPKIKFRFSVCAFQFRIHRYVAAPIAHFPFLNHILFFYAKIFMVIDYVIKVYYKTIWFQELLPKISPAGEGVEPGAELYQPTASSSARCQHRHYYFTR
jgi:hypothetical protein